MSNLVTHSMLLAFVTVLAMGSMILIAFVLGSPINE
jgi:hypothetical protein